VSNTAAVVTLWFSHGGASTPSRLDNFKTLADAIGQIITSLAVIVGGTWAYFKFARGRTLRPKLSIEMSGQWLKAGRKHWLQVRIKVTNIGTSKVALEQEGTWLEVKALAANQSSPPDYADWNSAEKYEVLDDHAWIEPGETVSDDLMLNLGIRPVPVRLDGRFIVRRKILNNIEVNARRVLSEKAVINNKDEGTNK
jgi:hypothetical protein